MVFEALPFWEDAPGHAEQPTKARGRPVPAVE
jgi:hypothetical protein